MINMEDLAEVIKEIAYWRNVANYGRGSEMTEALHQACDRLEEVLEILGVDIDTLIYR